MRFNHLRVLGGVGAVGAAAWSHGFWGRDYSLIPVEGSDGEKPEWLASTVDPETREATGRYLIPQEIDALGLGEDSSGETNDTDFQDTQSVAEMTPCTTFSWSTWLSCLLPTPEELVTDEAEVIVTNGLEICRDAIAGCEESSCDNGQSPFCAKTCGLYPCPPVKRDESAHDPSVEDEHMYTVSDAQRGCTIMSCMSLAGRMACMKTCTTFFTNPVRTPANETVADLDTTGDSYPACTVLDCMTLVGRLMCQKTCQFQPSQEVLENSPPAITDIEDLALDIKPKPASSLSRPSKRKHTKIEYELDNSSSAEETIIKEVMDHAMEDELHAQDEQKPTLPEVVLDDDSNGGEIMQILDQATSNPEVLWKSEELDDSLCSLLTVGAYDCISVDSMCRCFYLRLPAEDFTDCSHIYPNKKTAITVLKNRRLALFPYDECRCHGSKKTLHQGNKFYSCDLIPFSG
jgi:hypothetical protein